mmetsp:Transcript_91814/g.134207  ORF Transcript_91814/g.134207 Transcript_91814/m.134207 type:complete len:234 (-) Transcript_91814:543-1244(-)
MQQPSPWRAAIEAWLNKSRHTSPATVLTLIAKATAGTWWWVEHAPSTPSHCLRHLLLSGLSYCAGITAIHRVLSRRGRPIVGASCHGTIGHGTACHSICQQRILVVLVGLHVHEALVLALQRAQHRARHTAWAIACRGAWVSTGVRRRLSMWKAAPHRCWRCTRHHAAHIICRLPTKEALARREERASVRLVTIRHGHTRHVYHSRRHASHLSHFSCHHRIHAWVGLQGDVCA